MKLDYDTINKYIDGELDTDESLKVERILESSPEDYRNYKELSAIHSNLKRISEEEPSVNFTDVLMEKIYGLRKRKEDNLFILSISSFFILFSLVIMIFVIYQIISAAESGNSFSLYEHYSEGIRLIITHLNTFKESAGFSIVGAIFAFSIIISGFFYFEHQKNLRRINN